MEIIGVQRECSKPMMVLMADYGRCMDGAYVTLKPEISARRYETGCKARLARRRRRRSRKKRRRG